MSFIKAVFWILILAVLSGGISFYVTKDVINKKEHVEEKGVMVKIGDQKDGLITNIDGAHYIKIGIVLKVREDEYPKVEGKVPNPVDVKATDTIISTLRSHRADWYLGNQNQLKEDIKKDLNKAFGKPIILDVYINNFIIH